MERRERDDAGGDGGVYVSRATDIDWRDTSTRQKRKGREALSYVIFTPLAPSSTSCYLFPLTPLPPPLMTSSFYSRCRHAPIYRPTLLRVSSSSHPPPVPSISTPSFLRCSYEQRIYRLIRPPARPFVYLAITIVDRYDVGYTPRR